MIRYRPLHLAILIACSAAMAGAALAQESKSAGQGHVTNASSLKWVDAPPGLPKGSKIAVLNGDPGKSGPYSMMAKLPAGYTVPPHWHPQDENLVVISGALYIGMGDKLDRKNAEAIKPGGYAHMPPKMHHFAFTKAATVMEVHGMGPFEITYIDPADESRIKK